MTPQAAHRFRALAADGSLVTGTVDAADRNGVAAALASRGLLAIAIESPGPAEQNRRSIPWPDLALGLRLFADLLGAGLPLDRALAALGESAPESWRRILPGITERIRQGNCLGAALGHDSAGIPALVTSLILAGEAAGSAAAAIERAARLAESVAATRSAIRQALTYPVILLVAGLLAAGFLAGVVLPRFGGILAEMGQSPPATTRIVMNLAELTRVGAIPLLLTVAIGLGVKRAWTSTADGRDQWHALLLRLPLVGPVRLSLATARASEAVGALLDTAVVLPRAMEHGANACGDAAVGRALLRAREAVLQGDSVPHALTRERVFTATALRLIRAGHETGRLGPMFTEAGRLEHLAAERLIRTAVQIIEPAFILVFGGLVALVAASLLQALYGMRPV